MENQTKPEYIDIKKDWYQVKRGDRIVNIDDCCKGDNPDDPKGCDCCYDEWTTQLNLKQREYGKAVENATQAQARLVLVKSRRDGFKKWLDDLNQLDEYVSEICDQFDLIITQVTKICTNSSSTIKAVEILFCMIRDFYSQMDSLKIFHEKVMKCIKELNSTSLAPGTGIVKCLEVYNEKLDAVLKLKEELIKQMMEAIKIANMLQQDICSPYGLSFIFKEWQYILNCDEQCREEEKEPYKDKKQEANPCSDTEKDNKCTIYPQLTFPICKDDYKYWVEKNYETESSAVQTAAAEYLEASKKKEAISADINSLKEAVLAVDPKERCK